MHMTGTRTLSASTLMDEPVVNAQGERIGKIEDYMIELSGGCIEYAVLSFGGFMGIGDKLFAIPWKSMRLDMENHNWILNVSKETLDNAPGFDKNNWPDMSDSMYRDQLSRYWA